MCQHSSLTALSFSPLKTFTNRIEKSHRSVFKMHYSAFVIFFTYVCVCFFVILVCCPKSPSSFLLLDSLALCFSFKKGFTNQI